MCCAMWVLHLPSWRLQRRWPFVANPGVDVAQTWLCGLACMGMAVWVIVSMVATPHRH